MSDMHHLQDYFQMRGRFGRPFGTMGAKKTRFLQFCFILSGVLCHTKHESHKQEQVKGPVRVGDLGPVAKTESSGHA